MKNKNLKYLIPILYIISFSILFNTFFNQIILSHKQMAIDSYGVDLMIYHGAANALVNNLNPYTWSDVHILPYPVFSIISFSYLSLFSYENAFVIWMLIRMISIIISFILILYCFKPNGILSKHWILFVTIAFAFFDCIYCGFAYCNIQPIVFLLTCLFFCLLINNKDKYAGCILAMLCLIKITPVFIIPSLFFIKKKNVLKYWFIFMVGYAFLLLLTGWWKWELYLVKNILPNLGHSLIFCSCSIPTYIGKVFLPEILSNPKEFNLVSKLNMFIVFGISIVAYIKYNKANWKDILSTAFITMLLMSTAIETIHLTYLLPVLILLMYDFIEGKYSDKLFIINIVCWFMFIQSNKFVQSGLLFLDMKYLPNDFQLLFWLICLWILSLYRLSLSHLQSKQTV